MGRILDQKFCVLKEKKTVVTRANFWKIPHNSGEDDVRIKLGRYKKPKTYTEEEVVEMSDPKSELTLDREETKTFLEFLTAHYEPFKAGVKAYIPLDSPFEKDNASQIKKLFSLPNHEEVVSFILDNNVIPDDLRMGLENARRIKAVKYFEKMLDGDLAEPPWQKWFQKHDWVLGSEFVRVLDERAIDTQNISDFLMEAYDGFLDIVEIKRPEGGMDFWSKALDHGNYIQSSDLTKAITQAAKYIHEIERESNSIKFLEKLDGVRVIKPRGVLIFGRSHGWNEKQMEAYRILNASFTNRSGPGFSDTKMPFYKWSSG